MYSRGQKKLTFRFRATKSFVSFHFHFVSVSFPFYHDGILKSIVFVPIFRFAFSVFPSSVPDEKRDRRKS